MAESDPPDPPVLAHVLHRLDYAGAEVLAAALARQRREHLRTVFLCLDGVGQLGKALAAEGFVVHDLQRRPGIDRRLPGRIRAACHEHHVQLLHAHQYTPFFYASLSRGLGGLPPLLFTEHGRHYPDRRRFKRLLINPLLLRRRDRVTAVGHFVKQALVRNEGITAHRIEVIHNGIDPGQFMPPSPDARTLARRELGLDDHTTALLQVARFHPVKDHATALHALADLLPRQRSVVLLLAGDGPQATAMKQLATDLDLGDHVRFLGVRTDVPQLMAAADVFLLTSLSEGLSVTLLEAMAAALPIVATAVGGNPEVVEHETTGLLAPRQNHAQLADHLDRLIRDPALRRRLGTAGRVRLQTSFTQERMHQAYITIYQQMLNSTTVQ